MPISMALFQRSTTTALLPQVLAANGAIAVLSVPLGIMLGAPLVAGIGAQTTLLTCALATIALGVATAIGAILIRRAPDADASADSATPTSDAIEV